MAIASVTVDNLVVKEWEITDLDIEFGVLSEQTKLTPTPTPEKKPAGSVEGDVLEDEVGKEGDEFDPRLDDDVDISVLVPCSVPQAVRAAENGKKRCVPLHTLGTLIDSFG